VARSQKRLKPGVITKGEPMIHTEGKLYHNGDYALKDEKKLWTIKAIGRMVGQTPVVFTIQTPDASGIMGAYPRMILANSMTSLAEHFTLGFSWRIFDADTYEVDKSQFDEFRYNNGLESDLEAAASSSAEE
jgi:hypothetical protein